MSRKLVSLQVFIVSLFLGALVSAQPPAKVALGSKTAKAGFANEDEIAAKFNNWRTDADAVVWLAFMGFKPENVLSVTATKPHGEKADIQYESNRTPAKR